MSSDAILNSFIDDGVYVGMARMKISLSDMPGMEAGTRESSSSNYAFIKGPEELDGGRIEEPETQRKILDWLEKERSKGHKLVGAFPYTTSWIFEVTPNSVRFITDDS